MKIDIDPEGASEQPLTKDEDVKVNIRESGQIDRQIEGADDDSNFNLIWDKEILPKIKSKKTMSRAAVKELIANAFNLGKAQRNGIMISVQGQIEQIELVSDNPVAVGLKSINDIASSSQIP